MSEAKWLVVLWLELEPEQDYGSKQPEALGLFKI